MARKKIPENYEKAKQSIIQASIEIMVKNNMADFSLTDVSDAIGLTKAAIYWYFPNKNALIESVAQTVYDTYIGYAKKIASGSMEPYEKLKQIIVGESDSIHASIMCLFPIKFYLESYTDGDKIKAMIQEGYARFNLLISEIISDGIKTGAFHSNLPVKELAVLITASIDGLAFQNLLRSSEQGQIPRTIIFSVIENILTSK